MSEANPMNPIDQRDAYIEQLRAELAALREAVEILRGDTVILADTIRRLLEQQPLGKVWREIIPTMHPQLRQAVERAEALPTTANPLARAAVEGE